MAQCTATSKQSGVQCRRSASPGATVCKIHGAGAPQVKAAARRRLAEEQARRALSDVEVRPMGHWVDELVRVTEEVLAFKDHLASVVAELRDQFRFTDEKGAEQLDARVALYERALDRSGKFISEIGKLNLEDRRVQLEALRVELMGVVLVGVLDALGLKVTDARVRRVLEAWLPVLDGAPAPKVIDVKGPAE